MAPHMYLRTQMCHTDTQKAASVVYQTMKSQRLKVFMDSCTGINGGGTHAIHESAVWET